MYAQIAEAWSYLDLLILNASGGLEKDKPKDYATRLNRDAQFRLVENALPFMPSGGRIVFVTSHLAHFSGTKPVAGVYEPVARSKRAGEDALRAMIPELACRGISFAVVSGDLIEGTITSRLLQRANHGLIEDRRREVRWLTE
jgi:NAD(P)-dependent dehydrogenase (short-subunit alcohol dehydrogenase family)